MHVCDCMFVFVLKNYQYAFIVKLNIYICLLNNSKY